MIRKVTLRAIQIMSALAALMAVPVLAQQEHPTQFFPTVQPANLGPVPCTTCGDFNDYGRIAVIFLFAVVSILLMHTYVVVRRIPSNDGTKKSKKLLIYAIVGSVAAALWPYLSIVLFIGLIYALQFIGFDPPHYIGVAFLWMYLSAAVLYIILLSLLLTLWRKTPKDIRSTTLSGIRPSIVIVLLAFIWLPISFHLFQLSIRGLDF